MFTLIGVCKAHVSSEPILHLISNCYTQNNKNISNVIPQVGAEEGGMYETLPLHPRDNCYTILLLSCECKTSPISGTKSIHSSRWSDDFNFEGPSFNHKCWPKM